MIKRYNYRAYPTAEQAAFFQQVFGQCRFVYNYGLDLRIKSYEEDKAAKEGTKEKPRGLSSYDVSKRLTLLKKQEEFAWLNEGLSAAHNWALQHLDTAFKNFFKNGSGYPTFKSKHKSGKAFSFHQGYKIIGNRISVPKSGFLRFVKHRDFLGETKTVTVKQDPSGKYYISIVVDDGLLPAKMMEPDYNNFVGIDVGVINALTLSDGTQFQLGLDLSKDEKRIVKQGRELSRKKKGGKGVPSSNNFIKQKFKLAIAHEKLRLKREHAIKNLVFNTVQYVIENGYCGISLRNYDIKGMVDKDQVVKDENGRAKKGERKKRTAINKKIMGGAMGMLCEQLKQKCIENGINVFEFEANEEKTTAKCFDCGSDDVEISLKSRLIGCRNCGCVNDIDKNASKNIKRKASENQAA